MASIVEDDGYRLLGAILHRQHGQVMVNRPSLGAAVLGEASSPLAVGDGGRHELRQRPIDHLRELLNQAVRVSPHHARFFRGHGDDVACNSRDARGIVRVRGAQGEPNVVDPGAPADLPHHVLAHPVGNAEHIHRNQDRQDAARVLDDQRPREEPVLDAFRDRGARAVARKADGFLGSNVDLCRPCLKLRGPREARRKKEQSRKPAAEDRSCEP